MQKISDRDQRQEVKAVINQFTTFRERLPGILRALAIGIPAGYLFDLLDVPIPWMIGPMIAIATLNLMGVRNGMNSR